MTMPKPFLFARPAAAAALALAGLVLAGCSAVTAGSYLNTQADIAQYATFGWGAPDETPTGDPRLDNNPFFFGRVQSEIERGLAARGYTLTADDPDLQVHIHASVTQEINTQVVDQQFCTEGDCRPFVYDAGTLVIDLVDPAASRLVWRGWAESTFGEVIDNQAAMEQRIDESVAQILARFPGRR